MSVHGHPRLHFDPLKPYADSDKDPAFHSNADLVPACKTNADPDPQPGFSCRQRNFNHVLLIFFFQADTHTTRLFIWLQVSFVGCGSGENEKIAFNYGRELFVYPYRGIRKSSEAKLLDKRVYKVGPTVPFALEKLNNIKQRFF